MENKKNGCEHLRVGSSDSPYVEPILIHSTGARRHTLQPCRRRTPPLSRRRKRPLGAPPHLHPRISQSKHHNLSEPLNFPQPSQRTPIRNPPSIKRAFQLHRSTAILPIDGPPLRHQRGPLRPHRRRQPHRPLQQRLGPPSLLPRILNMVIRRPPRQQRHHQRRRRAQIPLRLSVEIEPPPRRPLASSSRHVVGGRALRDDILPAPEQ